MRIQGRVLSGDELLDAVGRCTSFLIAKLVVRDLDGVCCVRGATSGLLQRVLEVKIRHSYMRSVGTKLLAPIKEAEECRRPCRRGVQEVRDHVYVLGRVARSDL